MKSISIFHSQNVNQFDADAQAFFNVVTTLSNTEKSAYNTLVLGLKADGLWAKTIALYPILGGTAANHKWNSKDLRDLDAAFRITWVGTSTHASTGVTGNGTTGYGNTHFLASTDAATGLYAIGAYCRTNVDQSSEVLGANSNFNGQISRIVPREFNTFYGAVSNSNQSIGSVTDARGWLFSSRPASNASFVQRNATQTTAVPGAVGVPSVKMYFSARNSSGTADRFSTNEIALAGIWTALSTTEGTNLYNRIQTYQTTLGRNV